MSEAPVRQTSLAKGLVAGLIAGLVATAAKSVAERFYPPRVHGEPEPPDVLADKLAGHPLHGREKTAAREASFGLALLTLTHETALPAMGLSAPADEQTPREHTSEAATHLVYGLVAERVRSFVRGLLD